MERDALTVRGMAAVLGIRLGTAYGLLWDGTIEGVKDAKGEWVINRESVAVYQARRSARRERIRRSQSRSVRVIEVRPTTAVSHVLTTATGGATGRAL